MKTAPKTPWWTDADVSATVAYKPQRLERKAEPEPPGWRVWLAHAYGDKSWALSAAACRWSTLPIAWRAKIAREIADSKGLAP